jgi:hypothetical protein
MPLISGKALSQIVAELSRRNVKLYHACQLVDFRSYLQLGGVSSRNLLTTRGLPYTKFDTDERDRENSVWRLVFFNLSDFGYWLDREETTFQTFMDPSCFALIPK